MDDSDEFGFSSGDEAAFAIACENSGVQIKRKHTNSGDNDESPAKRQFPRGFPRQSPLAVKILNEKFGLDAFRLEQEAVIARLLDGGSAVVVFPTGGGKSLCYQVPAVAFAELDKQAGIRGPNGGGVTIVVSPLIALMKDQVDALVKRKIKAACMDSTKTRQQYMQINDDLKAGVLQLLYCAPERLNNEGFIQSIKSVRGGVRLVAVDEAHCISEWGHAFRPDYLKVARFVTEIQAERVVCLTATATPKVAQDICDAFSIEKSGLFRTTMYRPNLRLVAEATSTKQEKFPKIFKFLRENLGSTIIYVTLKKQAEALSEDLQRQGFHAKHFHAGMETDIKTKVQDEFMTSNTMIIVATIAFGMGIDKADIRNIIHFDIPSSVEGYSQQIGRAGRDGKPSVCLFYLCQEDFYMRNIFTYGDLPSRHSVRQFLEDVCCPANRQLEAGDSFSVNHYDQSRQHDIRPNALAILYSQLELRFNYIRAGTPRYSNYTYEPIIQHSIKEDESASAMAIKSSTRKASKWHHVDVEAAGNRQGVNRADIVRKLNEWSESGIISLKTSGLQHVYHIVQKLPPTSHELDDIMEKLYTQMLDREQQDLRRTKEVIRLITSKTCISRGLAAYFDDDSHELPTECGHCTWCETRSQVVLPDIPPSPPNHALANKIVQACKVMDDPRFLARIAFGITSPRVTTLKLGKHELFGSMNTCDFMELVRTFAEICGNDSSEYTSAVLAT
ncbi:ATP-dependent DNA helicase-like protein recQ [Glonium stellatum]|uniref:ATP-dependent DNA helicase n=1 Tax=Glonium stellatum TaxID=574774 RepID=A0A8E2JUP0_9PEZI|nr:ATP-dependent DNA helicase-like protein recQ [Glonium stellatum]